MVGTYRPTRGYAVLLALVACSGLAATYVGLTQVRRTHWFDWSDIRVYHKESGWVAGQGTLYQDVPSEYPLAANLLFAACRVVSDFWRPLAAEDTSYALVWIWLAWLVYLAVAHDILTRLGWLALALWLAPGALFFAVFRYDIYPTATTWLALVALRDGRYARGALWVGVTIALKGYALFALPALLVFVMLNRGWGAALKAAVLAVAPFLVANLVVLSFAGFDGMLSPYQFHARRANYGECSLDALYYVMPFLFSGPPRVTGALPGLLQLACAFLAAGMRPRTFDDLVRALLVAVLGFMSFSVFYSPQYCLWILPLACFSRQRSIQRLALAYGWLTFLYFPVYHVIAAQKLTMASAAAAGIGVRLVMFRACVVAVTLLRIVMMACALRRPVARPAVSWFAGSIPMPRLLRPVLGDRMGRESEVNKTTWL
jgi:hypothetical protein